MTKHGGLFAAEKAFKGPADGILPEPDVTGTGALPPADRGATGPDVTAPDVLDALLTSPLRAAPASRDTAPPAEIGPDLSDFAPGLETAPETQTGDIRARVTATLETRLPDWSHFPAFDLVEHVETCGCVGCHADREEPSEAGEAITGETTGNLGILSDMAEFLTTGFWNTGYGDGTRSHNVTDSGIDPNAGVLHYNVTGYSDDIDGLTGDRIELVREAFKLFEATLGIQFVETTSQDTGLVDFFFSDNSSGAYASHGYWNSGQWGSTITSAEINVAASWSGGTSSYDDYTFQTILHEIGHAMGLGHQGPYNGSASYGTDNVFDNDNWQSSMMSYFSQTQATAVDASYEFLQTPMVVDWMALDALYGRQGYGVSNAFTEDTVWGFNTTVTEDVSRVWATWWDWADRTASTLVDGGGVDTLDLSGYSNNTLINLAPSDPGATAPSSSDIGGRIGNLTIAAGTIIENAIGGAGSETFYGNAADNTLIGNGGDDTFHDSAGSDTYVGGAGNDFVLFGQAFVDYTISLVDGVLQVLDGVADWVENTVEWLTFSDQTLSWQAIADGSVSNTAPRTGDDAFAVDEDQILTGRGLLDNDSDPDGDTLAVATVEGVSVATSGTTVTLASGAVVTMFADGTFEYDQNGAFDALNPGEAATDSFTYRATDGISQSAEATVSIVIAGQFDNSGPLAQNDSYRLDEDGVVWGSVLTNDTDPDGDALSVTALNGAPAQIGTAQTLASGATVILNADGTFQYDTNGAFDSLEDGQTATDRFSYTIADGQGGTDTADVTLTIDGISPPMITESVVIDFEGAASGSYAGDYGLSFSGLAVAATGALGGARAGAAGADGDFTITAAEGSFDLNSLSLIGLSGRQKVVFQAYSDGILVGSFQANASTRKPTDVTFDASFDGIDQIIVTGAADYFIDNIALVTRMPLDPDANYAPVAVNDTLATGEASAVQGNLLDNDTDPNGDSLSLLSIEGDTSGQLTLASGATVTFAANGDMTYDPNGAFDALYDGQTATDSFTYAVSDGQGGISQATASITIAGSGVAPIVTSVLVDFDTAVQTSASTVTDAGFVFDGGTLSGGALNTQGTSLTIQASNGDTFDFESAVITAAGRGKESVTIDGYLDGVLIGSDSFNLRAGQSSTVTLSDAVFDTVDAVVLTSDSGFGIDDLSFLT